MEFSIKDFPSKFDQIRSFLRIWPDLLKKSLIGNFIFCTVGFGAKIGGWLSQDLNVHMRFRLRRIGMWLNPYHFMFQVIIKKALCSKDFTSNLIEAFYMKVIVIIIPTNLRHVW